MLLQDSLSEVAATIPGANGEDGVVEGTNSHELVLKFLDRGSQVKIGDFVVTSGLGNAFPPGIPIGWVEGLEPDPRQLFMQARLRPAARSNQIRVVLVLVL
jgi:rod shape-determining protein MreC